MEGASTPTPTMAPDLSLVSSLEELLDAAVELYRVADESRWVLGDLLSAARSRWRGPGLTRAAAEALGCSTRHIQNLIRVANTFAPTGRIPNLSWEHHRLAAATADPLRWLALAADNLWSTRQLRDAIQGEDAGPDREDAATAADVLCRRVREYAAQYDDEAGLRRVGVTALALADKAAGAQKERLQLMPEPEARS